MINDDGETTTTVITRYHCFEKQFESEKFGIAIIELCRRQYERSMHTLLF